VSNWSLGPSAGSVSTEHLIRLADYAIAKLIGIGIQCGPHARIVKARAALVAFQRQPTRTHDAIVVSEAVRTAIEFHFIARTFGGTSLDGQAALRQALNQSLTGSLDPRVETNPIARNSQFELVAGSFLSAGGLPIAVAEPDLIAIIADEEIGVAAKRVTSRRKIINRVKAAVKQIERTERRGIVALNVDSFVSDVLHGVDADVAGASFAAHLPELALAHDLLTSNRLIRGLLVRGTKVSIRTSQSVAAMSAIDMLDVTTFEMFHLYAGDSNDTIVTDRLLERFQNTQRERLSAVFRAS
jgi:hypothetical protein